jgi:translation elongation factor EF-Tu-like GTPase
MAGTLGEVFDITGRGVVVILKDFDGSVRVGDRVAIGSHSWEVSGIEMGLRPLDPDNPPARKGVGVLLRGASKAELLPLVGEPVSVSRATTS